MASPSALMPYAQGPAALEAYLRKQGIEYLLCADFDADDPGEFCSRRYWNFRLTCPIDTDGRVAIDRIYAVAALDFMDNVDAMARASAVTFNEDGLRVIRLQ
jgi:hypothetical protein